MAREDIPGQVWKMVKFKGKVSYPQIQKTAHRGIDEP